ncbi:MAG: hypothetical protein ABUT20_22235 [Bacteroidota bacterium]
MRNKKFILSVWCLLFSFFVFAQTQFSIATDLSFLHSFKKDQQFNAVGQTVIVHFHFTPKEGAYIWYAYSSPGKFKNNFEAVAKSPSTTPQSLDFKSYSQIGFHSLSIGWKHYLKGANNSDGTWNLYFTAGFGLVGGKVQNTYTIPKDTAKYSFPANPVDGKGKFKRLTFDVALGYEIPIGMAIYMYGEARCWIPTTDYPSKYLFINDNAPLVGTANIGLRIFFD